MVETITPMVHGGSRSRWAISVTLHVVAATLVAAVFGALLGAAGEALGAPWGSGWAAIVVGIGSAALLREAGMLGFPVPQLRRQVPNWWRTYFGPHAAAALYGGALGVGFLTFVRYATLLVVVIAAASTGDPVLGALMVAPFGLARAAAVGLAGFGRQAETVDRLNTFAATSRVLPVANAVAAALVTLVVAPSLREVSLDDVSAAAGAALAVTFGWGVAWKTLRFGTWRWIVASYGLGPLRVPTVIGVPLVETAIVMAILSGRVRVAALLAVGFLAAASLAIALARGRGRRRLRCGCFGAAEIDTGRALLRNAGLGAVAALSALGAGSVPPSLPRVEVLPLALAVGGIAGITTVAVLVRGTLGRSRIAEGGS